METLKKLWEKVKSWILKLWQNVKSWAIKTAWPWIKKGWMQAVNVIIVFIAYANLSPESKVEWLIGLWLFVLLAYYIFWKLLGIEHWFKKPIK